MKPTVTLVGYALVIIGLINCEKNNPSSESNGKTLSKRSR
jgi:hypothetical protein